MKTLPISNFRTFTVLAFIVTFTMFLFSFTLRDPSLTFFKYAIRKSDSFFTNGQCGCRQCMTELEDDPWFTERFNLSVHPLMSRKSSLLTYDTYRWWQRLQGEKDPANFSEVVEKMFHVIPDDDDLYMDAGPERCRTCAVVGNSGNLKGSRYGPLIDSSDVIIRMNMAPTSGFEEDVGSRTTHHVMYPESAKDLDNTTTSLLLIPFKTLDLQWITSALTTGSIKQTYIPVRSRIKVLIYSPTFFKYVYDTWLESHGRYPSTGFLSIMFAVHICDKVSVYGFGRDQYGNWHHYWEDDNHGGAFRKTGVHDADQEYNVTQLLADKHKINIFKGF
uniref:CMP-N-acetylneuraminate-beta-galactosamide-alpha-2,3-sialyltransferase 1 n=1 Tax=Hucho hucho TaxID=62062 RepID=A0A4W5Q1U5_9TELE